jgi:hypothetical protein
VKIPVLQIRDVISRIRLFSIPDPDCLHPGSSSKNFSILTQKKWLLSSKKYDLGSSSRIPDQDADFLPIPDPGSKGQKGTQSRIPDPDPQHWMILEWASAIEIYVRILCGMLQLKNKLNKKKVA